METGEGFSEEALEAGRLLFAGPVEFVKGVVDLKGLPPADRAEVCFAGRSNVGKSSLLNRLAGFDRSLVDATAGTTRDAVDTVIERRGRRYRFVDTAGLRKKGRIAEDIESWAASASVRAPMRLLCRLMTTTTKTSMEIA